MKTATWSLVPVFFFFLILLLLNLRFESGHGERTRCVSVIFLTNREYSCRHTKKTLAFMWKSAKYHHKSYEEV